MPFTILILGLVLLIIIMFFVWAKTGTFAWHQQTPSVWAPFAWTAAWGLLATLGLGANMVPGLVLCVRPALFALITHGSGSRAVRNWPRLTGLALVLFGAGAVGVAVPPLAQLGQVARGLVPEIDTTMVSITLATAGVPALALMLAALLLPPARRRPPAAEDGLAPGQN